MPSDHFHTIVVGGGIAGLATAHRLARELGRDRVHLLEASDYLGGHVRTTREAGYQLDWGPNGFLDREPKMLEWIRELGLEGELISANQAAARRFLLRKGRLVELVGPPKFLVAPLLSVPGRLRLLMEPLIPARRDTAPESVFDFAARRIGREAAETLVSAMVLGVFGGDAHQLSLQHCFPRMAAMEREHGGLFRAMMAARRGAGAGRPRGGAPTVGGAGRSRSGGTEGGGGPMGPGGTLTSLRGGIGRLAERAAEALGDVAQREAPVSNIEKINDGFVVYCGRAGARPSPLHCKNVVLATPAYVAAELVRGLAPELAARFGSVKYASLVVACTGFRRERVGHDLRGFGYLIPPREECETLGCLWTTSIFPGAGPEGGVLLRTMMGGALHPETVERSDEELFAIVKRDVFDVVGATGTPALARVFRHRRAIPQYGLDHGEVLQAAQEAERAYPGLYFTGSAFRGVAMIDCVADAFRVAERVAAE